MSEKNTLRELQLVEAKMLHDFKVLCEKHNLKYYLSSGTLLGAVRHGGFIPWDDDIDVAMPYVDYLKFLEIAQNELGEEYFVQTSWTDDNYHRAYTKIRLNNTTYLEPYHVNYYIHHGVWIDILPLVEINEGMELVLKKNIVKYSNWLQMENFIWSHYDEFSSMVGEKMLRLLKLFYKIPLRFRKWLHKFLLDIIGRSKNKDSLAEVWAGITKIYPKAIYEGEPSFVEFEGESYMAPTHYKEYLRIVYGDYMQLPPEDKRGGHGINMILDLENDYSIYMKHKERNC